MKGILYGVGVFAALQIALAAIVNANRCHPDNCLRALSIYPSASDFCSSYLATTNLAQPTSLSNCEGSSSRISSACSCYISPTTLATTTIPKTQISSPTPSAQVITVTTTVTVTASANETPSSKSPSPPEDSILKPRIFIVSLFTPEAAVWPIPLNLSNNITVPGFSPIFPDAHCNPSGTICQMTAGEGEINAASSTSALILSPLFDLTKTYFLIAGIAGINPSCGTLGSVCFAQYAIQVGLEYEIDTRELETNYTSGYIPLGSKSPTSYPLFIYGTEVFELSSSLQNKALSLASTATLLDSPSAAAYRSKYPFAPANQTPQVFAGDIQTSDAFWHGALLGDAFSTYVDLLTNSSGKSCMTAQEDNAILESMTRGAVAKLVDFSRVILMRTGANFDRPPPGESAAEQLLWVDQGGLGVAVQNIYQAGRPIVDDVVGNWETYEGGLKVVNYLGDIFGSIKGQLVEMDIGSPDRREG